MSLAEEAMALTRRSGVPCAVATLDAPLRAELEAALAKGITATSLSRALRNRGIIVTDGILTRHRRADCACQP